MLRGFERSFFGLRDREARSCDFALVAIEDGQIDVEEKRAAVDAGGVRVIEADAKIFFAVGALQSFLAARRGDAFLGGAQVGAILHRQTLQRLQSACTG